MIFKGIRNCAVKAIALIGAAVIGAGCMTTYAGPAQVNADEVLYDSLYDMFKDRSGDPDNFMSQEVFVQKVLDNCDRLKWIDYTYGGQENYLGCDGFVSLVFRLTFDTLYDFDRDADKYWCMYDYHEEHIVAASPVDKYEVFRPGGTTVTWLYHNYVDEIVKSRDHRELVEGLDNEGWIEYLNELGAQPGDILFWDDDNNDKYWAHIGFYAGIEDGYAKIWHASSLQGLVIKQKLEEITCDVGYLKYVSVLPLTKRPARTGLCVDTENSDAAFSYSFYSTPDCDQYIGRMSSSCELSEQAYLNDFPLYLNSSNGSFEQTLYFTRDMSPFSIDGGENAYTGQKVYQMVIRIEPVDDKTGTLRYDVYGVDDIKYYGGGEIRNYNYVTGGRVIPVIDFR